MSFKFNNYKKFRQLIAASPHELHLKILAALQKGWHLYGMTSIPGKPRPMDRLSMIVYKNVDTATLQITTVTADRKAA